MSARNGNTRGRLIAVGGSGGRSISVAAKRSEHEALAQIFQFVTVDAEQSIFRSTPPHPRGLFLANQRKPWKDHNRKALTEWLGHRPEFVKA